MLTDRQIKSLKADRPQMDVFDGETPGFGVRVTNRGRKSFFLFYRARRLADPRRRLHRVTLGAYPYLSLAEARERARAILREVETGKDPSSGLARQYSHRRSKNRPGAVPADPRLRKLFPEGFVPGTFGELAALYMVRHAWVNLKSPRHHEEALRRDLLPRWRDTPLAEVTRREISDLLGQLINRGARAQANQMKKYISGIWSWGLEQGIAESNPAAGMKVPVRLTPRDRYLSEREIAVLWQTLDQRSEVLAGAYKAILLTACRPGEVLGLRWEEISEDGRWWVIPEARSKNGLAHRVFLTPPMRQILAARRAAAGASPFVFPTTRDGSAPQRFQTHEKLRQAVGFEFNPHDLRRTASTHLARLGVQDEIREALLNHKKKGLRGVYNLYEYDREKQEALELWANTIAVLTAESSPARIDAELTPRDLAEPGRAA
jgi:integrase